MTRRLRCRVFINCVDAALASLTVLFRCGTYNINGAGDSGTLPRCYISLDLSDLEEYTTKEKYQALMNVSDIGPGEVLF